MTIYINGEPREFPTGLVLQELLVRIGQTHGRFAVEINRDVVPRSAFGAHVLNAGDRIEIVRAIGGG